MTKKVYHLSTCNTCQKIMAQVPGIEDFEQINIKEKNISAKDLDFIAKKEGGYENVFSRRAMKFRSEGWNEKELTEKDYRMLILKEYTFLKRPVFIIDDAVFAGNKKSTVEEVIAKANEVL